MIIKNAIVFSVFIFVSIIHGAQDGSILISIEKHPILGRFDKLVETFNNVDL